MCTNFVIWQTPWLTYPVIYVDVDPLYKAGVVNCRAHGKQQALHCTYHQFV